MIPVLYEAGDWIAVDKPPGVVTVPARDEDPAQSLWRRLEAERGERLWVVHRLDRDTSGLVVLARTAEGHRAWSRAFEARRVEKVYLAFTRGLPSASRIDAPLVLARRGRVRVAAAGETGAKPAQTSLAVLRRWGEGPEAVALVQCRPHTGRQHQIRVHLASVGAPLLFDPLYGSASPDLPIARLALHASSLTAPADLGGDELVSPMPADFVAVQRALERGGA